VPPLEPVLRAIISIAVLVFLAKLLGELFLRLRLPEVLGELFAGIIFGPYTLGSAIKLNEVPLVEFNEIVFAFAEIGAIIVLFLAGLEMTFAEFRAAGPASFAVASGGVVLPLVAGYWVYTLLGMGQMEALIIGAALTATSIAISVKALESIGKLDTTEAHILINAAVIDDVLGLTLLAVVSSIAGSGVVPTPGEIASVMAKTLFLWVLLVSISVFAVPRLIHRTELWRVEGSVEATAIAVCFGSAALAAAAGLSPIVGAFAAGMAVAGSRVILRVKEFISHLGLVFSPIFFGVMGANVDPATISARTVIPPLALLAIAVATKVVGCWGPALVFLRDGRRALRVGVGMVSRGEVGLIIAGVGLTAGAISPEAYAEVVAMVIATTMLTPILLVRAFREKPSKERPADVTASATL